MKSGTPGWRRALALLVIGHGLAHAVLPLRGSMAPGMFEHNFMPVILYGVAVLGFTTAGIGLFGVKPFTSVVRPFLVLASGYSLVAIVTAGQGELWWGAALDVMLLLTALTGIYRRLPQGPSHPGLPHRVAVATGAVFALYVAGALVLWPVHRAWGSWPEEYVLSLPGDPADRNPALELQHAVTIAAPAISYARRSQTTWAACLARTSVGRSPRRARPGAGAAELGRVRVAATRRQPDAIHHPHHRRQSRNAGVDGGDRHDGLRAAALHHAAQDDAANQEARRRTSGSRGNDVSDVILASASTIANEWRTLAAAWHVVIAGLLAALWWRRVDARSIAGWLALMSFSVGTLAWWSGNPFNAAMFYVVGIVMVALAATVVAAQVSVAAGPDVAAGAIMCVFGWVYPHFLDGPAWQYLYAAPLGLIPCPTLAFIIGVSLLTNSFGSKTWAILFGSLGLLYGLIGVFVLHVTIDWYLIAGAAALLARIAAPLLLLEPVTIDREKRHV